MNSYKKCINICQESENRGLFMYDLNEILVFSVKEKASDIHFTVGKPPCFRKDGVLTQIEGERLTPKML